MSGRNYTAICPKCGNNILVTSGNGTITPRTFFGHGVYKKPVRTNDGGLSYGPECVMSWKPIPRDAELSIQVSHAIPLLGRTIPKEM